MTMPSKARRLGNAFRLGVIYAAGATAAMDEAKWITVHPDGTGGISVKKPLTLTGRMTGAVHFDITDKLPEED